MTSGRFCGIIFFDIFYYYLNFLAMVQIDLTQTAYRFKGRPVEEMTLFENGSFSVVTAEEKGKLCYVFNKQGQIFLPGQRFFEQGAVLANGYSLLKENAGEGYTLYNELFEPVCSEIEDVQVFANDWYELECGGNKRLFNADHKLMAEGYGWCQVFNAGYCVDEDKDGNGNVVNFYLPNGRFYDAVSNLLAVVGDGCMLLEHPDDCAYDVVRLDKKIIAKNVVSEVCEFANGRFVLKTYEDDCAQMFEANGDVMSVKVKDATFLADGRFIVFEEPGHRIVGLYDQNGIVTKVSVWELQKAGNFYLVSAEQVSGRLFNDKMEVVGDGYCLVSDYKEFALFEHNGPKLELFNRNGCVFSSDEN